MKFTVKTYLPLQLGILTLLMMYTSAFAQPEQSPFSSGVSFGIGIQNVGLANLNQQMTNLNFGEFPELNTYYRTGVSLGRKTKLACEFSVNSFMAESLHGNGNYATLTDFGLFADFHYSVFHSKKIYLSPLAGIGMSAITLSLSDQKGAGSTFGALVSGLSGQRTIYTAPLAVINVGFRAYAVVLDIGRQLAVGTQFGYKYQISKTEWGTDGYLITNGPEIQSGGFYAEIVVVFQ